MNLQEELQKEIGNDTPTMGSHSEESANEPIKANGDSAEGPIVMRVRKRDGSLNPVDVNKIVNVALACSTGLKEVDPMRVAAKVISGLYDGASTKELDQLCIQTAALLIGEEPQYSKLAARLLARFIGEEVTNQHIRVFSDSVRVSYENGLISKEKYD